ncbi:EamA family transporter [Leptospira perolatii]|nr:EamA family transporter [Leptospira perolatii]
MPRDPKILFAYVSLYIIWGSTYLALKEGQKSMSIDLFLGIRLFLAAFLNFAISYALIRNKFPLFTRENLQEALKVAIIGALIIVSGQGLTSLSMRYVDSHMAAVVIAGTPIYIVIMQAMSGEKWSLSIQEAYGMGLGILGIAILSYEEILIIFQRFTLTETGVGIFFAFLGSMLYGGFSYFTRNQIKMKDPLAVGGFQMLGASFVFLAFSLFSGGWSSQAFVAMTPGTWWALCYLVVFGSTIGHTAYSFIVRVEPPNRVYSYTYINPIIAILVGAWLGGENLKLQLIPASLAILLGVYFILGNQVLRKQGSPISVEKKVSPLTATNDD